jgi:hypothetical protein
MKGERMFNRKCDEDFPDAIHGGHCAAAAKQQLEAI